MSVNWGKKSILTDIKSPDGKERFVDLLASADVLISSQRPGALDRLGLSEAEVVKGSGLVVDPQGVRYQPTVDGGVPPTRGT